MYKKIKNGSFMNLIWFIIATLPFALLIIYAIGFFNNEDLRANEQDNYTLNLNSISGNTLKEETNLMNYTSLNNEMLPNENGYFTSVNKTTYYNLYISANQTTTTKYLYLFSNKLINNNNYVSGTILLYFGNSLNESLTYTINNDFTNQNVYANEIELQNIWNTFTTQATWNNTQFSMTYNTSEPINFYIIASATKLYLNYNWFNNYINYVNDFNTIKYNSCPISYTYNNNTYNIETNNNNYLGTNETLEINQNFNYTLNEQPTLNYNNYFISNMTQETFLGANVGNDIQLENNYNFSKVYENSNFIYEYNQNYTYYIKNPSLNLYRIREIADQTQYNQLKNILYITNYTNIEYEYYNIESTINASIELIPNNNFENFLTNVNNTIKTNGFISSAFLNLATLFSVNNIYYSLACYYIEYLLVIALLHLAFDVLYMLPNICHKFMEKLGGERD